MIRKSGYPVPRPRKDDPGSPAGPVKMTFDPGLFKWYQQTTGRGEMAISVTERDVNILSAAARVFQGHVGKQDDYRVVIGVAKKAIAIRLAMEGEKGWRMRRDTHSGALVVSCIPLVKELDWELPVRLEAVWDEEHGMIVGRMA